MYVRCPRCKSEISFEPTNMSSLGDRYKIKCPNCGATIGAKLPTEQQLLDTDAKPQTQATSKKKQKVAKKSGAGRNIVMFLISLIFVGLSIVSYLYGKGIIQFEMPVEISGYILSLFAAFNGITSLELLIVDFAGFQAVFADLWIGIGLALQIAIFILAALNLLASFICLCARTYSRSYNLITNILLAGASVVSLFTQFIASGAGPDLLGQYFVTLIETQQVGLICLAGLGVVSLFFSLCFLGSLKKKEVEEKAPKAAKKKAPKKDKKK